MFSDNNLFNPQWTTGSLNAISPLVQVIGFFAMCLISIGGFFMVILPLMRNVINGIVVVAPNLCDKIDEAHRNKLGLRHGEGGGNQIQMVIGSLMMVILSFFPNFKAMSDFEEGIRDPKSFMIKALPMMCVYIFIGVFIFYGYPAKVAEKASGAATSMIDMALNNVDPVAWVEKLPTKMTKPDLATANATDNLGQNTNKLSKSMYTALTSKYGEMSKDNRVAMSHAIEEYANGMLSEISDKSDSPKYKMTVESRVMTYDPKTASSPWPTPAHDTVNNIFVYTFKDNVASKFDIGVPGDITPDHFMVVLKFYELSEKADKATAVRSKATFYASSTETKLTSGTGSSKLVLSGTYFTVSSGGGVNINGIAAKKVSKDASNNVTIEFAVSSAELKKASGGTTSGIFYIDPNNKSFQHPISSITWKEGSSKATFTPEDTTGFNGWTLGGGPSVKKSTDGEESTSTRASDDKKK